MGERIIKAAAELQPGDIIVIGPYGGQIRVGDAYVTTADDGRTVAVISVHGAGRFEVPPFMAVAVVDA